MKNSPHIREDLYHFAVGFCMGGANVIPGVSGGTMLFIMGAFTKLTEAIRSIASVETLKLLCKGQWKALYERIPWRFLFAIGVGILVSFATLAKLLVWLMANQQQYTYAFFFGLIAASIITVKKQIKKWSPGAWISLAISTIAAFGIVSLVPVNGGSQWYMLMLYGAICIIAMILPGLSGSFLLLIFGQYQKVWNAVGNFAHFQWSMADFCTLLFLAAGALIGIASFVHLLNWLLKNFYNVTIAALIGFMIGAIPRLWPWQIEANNHFSCCAPATDITMLWTILCTGAGLLLVLAVEYFASNKTNKEYQ